MHSDSYVVLARKWRPAQFKDIVGQSHIVRTLNNAIRTQRLHHAYLFTGSRGVGKTSIARIFAKAIRCESLQDSLSKLESDSFLQSCDQCSSCREITQSSSVDVVEIDGASNNGVEAVREIRDHAKYMPSRGDRKIYIIDEVHMLTTAAFNALLKTLEEPPAHVIFIFATTEPHKIPATVLSRCQRFDYKRVTISQIQTRLTEITESEGVSIEPTAITLIARAAEGSMRDALSLLDQVIAFSSGPITLASVRESIGLIEGQSLIQILSGIFNRRPADALACINQAHEQGHDLRVLTRGLIEFLYYILLIQVDSLNRDSIELTDEEVAELQTLAQLRSTEEIELFFQVFHHGLETLARSPQPKVVLSILIIKCATAQALVSLETHQQSSSTGNTSLEKSPQAPSPQKPASSPVPSPQGKVNPDTAPATQSAPAPTSSTEKKTWEGLISHIKKSRPLLASILEHSSGTLFPETSAPHSNVTIFFSPENAYFREQLQARIYQEQLSQLSREYLGYPIRLQIECRTTGESLAARRERETQERRSAIRMQAANHPIISEAKALFGGELAPIQLIEDAHAELSS